MKTIHRINSVDIYSSLKYFFWFLYALPFFTIVSIPFAYYVKGWDWDRSLTLAPIVAFVALSIFIVLPTIIMHLSHYFSNKDLIVEIDRINNKVTFIKDSEYSYRFSKLKAELHTPIYHKNKLDKRNRWLTPWSNYSYLNVITSDKREFNISSILIDSSKFPIEIESTHYALWPSIRNWKIDHEIY